MRRAVLILIGVFFITSVHAQMPKAATYQIPSDVVSGGGGDGAKSTNFLLDDTLGEPNVGFGKSDLYDINAGYRQPDGGTYIGAGCTNLVNLGSITFSGIATGSGSCTVTTDSNAGYQLSWRSGVNNNDRLVGYWPLDETTGTTAYDMSGYQNGGTHTNSPTISGEVPRRYFSTRSLSFDGSNDYVTFGDIKDPLSDSYTVSLWFNSANNSPSHGQAPIIAAKGNVGSAQEGWTVWINNSSSNKITVRVNASDSTLQRASQTGPAISTGQWYHVAMVIDRSTNKIKGYLNGTDAGWVAGGGGPANDSISGFGGVDTSDRLMLGDTDDGTPTAHYFQGNIDDFRIYNRALSAEEIHQLASKAIPGALVMSGSQIKNIAPLHYPATGGLLGMYRLDEPVTGTVVADASGYNNDGTPSGASGTNNKPQPSTTIPTSSGVRDFRSLSFDGTDDVVNVGSASMFDNMSAMTISAWINPTTLGESSLGRIFSKRTAATTGWWDLSISGTNTISFGADYGTTDIARTSADNAITLGQWQHVVVTWDGSSTATNIHMYVNGAEVSYQTTTNGVGSRDSDAAQSVIIGNWSGGDRTFDGLIDDARIYNRVLTAEEVKALYGTPQTWSVAASEAAWGARLQSSSTDIDSKWGTDGASEKWLHVGDGDYTLVTRNSSNHPTGSTEKLEFKAEIGSSVTQPGGVYRTVVLVTATSL